MTYPRLTLLDLQAIYKKVEQAIRLSNGVANAIFNQQSDDG